MPHSRVLVVDDARDNVRLLFAVLRDLYQVQFALHGADALRLAREEPPDLILLDVMMPDLDGYSVCRLLKADPRTRDVPVIFITSLDDIADEERGLALGAIDYITKPIHPAIVRARVRNHLQLKHSQDLLRTLSEVDGLTGIANRRRLDEQLDREWRRAQRFDRPLSVLLVDVDAFKLYNDHYGHLAGDACLCRVADSLRHAVHRASDLVARYGGEEFVVMLPDTPLDRAVLLGNQVLQRIRELALPHAVSPVAATVTVSIGAACQIPNTTSLPAALLERADRALYRAKHSGRNRLMSDETV